jgi:AMP-binding enzyme
MILDEDTSGHGATLDDLFRRAGVRHPQAQALVDPPNRESFSDGPPRSLTFTQADRAISALAARLRGLGLSTDSVVAIQLANTVENVIVLLAVLRAGMIAAPLPLLWRQQEIVAALGRLGAKAIVTAGHIGAHPHAEIAMQAAVELFPIRYVCAFGRDLPDGVVSLDGVEAGNVQHVPRPGPAAAHVAVVNFEVTAGGIVPVARHHTALIAGGLAAFLEAGMAPDTALLSTVAPSSFPGIALTLVTWLLGGGALHLHHGFDAATFAAQARARAGGNLVLPGPALTPLADAGDGAAMKNIVALWRAPERLALAPPWRGEATLTDVASFGEIGLVGMRRGTDGAPAPIPLGSIGVPRGATDAIAVIETVRSGAGTLGLRGPMVPRQNFPPGAGLGQPPHLALDETGVVDTGYPCRREPDGLIVTGPPAGIASVGGYRFGVRALETAVAGLDGAATIAALPDALTGERLAGSAADAAAIQAALGAGGANPLVAGAFRARARGNGA